MSEDDLKALVRLIEILNSNNEPPPRIDYLIFSFMLS